MNNQFFLILNEKFQHQEPEPPFFAWSRSWLQDLGYRVYRAGQAGHGKSNFQGKDYSCDLTLAHLHELFIFCRKMYLSRNIHQLFFKRDSMIVFLRQFSVW